MREIKFRLWDGKKMIEQEECLSGSNGFVGFVNFWTGYEDPAEWAEYKLMQYTGLKDRNGVEIYEGDIVRRIDEKISGQIIYAKTGCFGFRSVAGGGVSPIGAYTDIIEVIGNIYENPELLQEQENDT